MVLALLAVIAISGAWVVLGTYSRIETAPGLLVTTSPSTKLYAPVPGTVVSLAVAEGTFVHKGDRIAVINLDRQSESGHGYVGDALGIIDRRMGVGVEQRQLSHDRLASELGRYGAAIGAARDKETMLANQIALQREVVDSAAKTFAQLESVVSKGFVSKLEYERRHQAWLNARQDLSRLEERLVDSGAEAREAEAQMTSLRVESAREVSEIKAATGLIDQQRVQIQAESGYVVTAPIDGRVTALQIAQGRTAAPNAPMMTIVPVHTPLRAEIYAPTRAIGFVRPGQEVRLLYDAFPYDRFGTWGGRVESVSRIIIDPRETDIPLKLEEPVYRITVAVADQTVSAYGSKMPLQAGMTLKATIVLDRQSFLDWLLAPLRAVRNREK